MAHRSGEARQQTTLFPVMLDELVGDDAVVRVIDAWVGSLDLKALGFSRTQPALTGRPPYDPADLLKLYVYGYLNGVRSSRRLERECARNVVLMWMLGRLAPDHKTIANFRQSESAALVESAAAFVQFARAQGLIAGETVAIDGTKLRAVASRKAVVGQDALQACQERLNDWPDTMRQRRSTVEHPYGTIKDHILGNARLLMRGIAGARAELSLAVLAYNLKRVLNMKGSHWTRNAVAA